MGLKRMHTCDSITSASMLTVRVVWYNVSMLHGHSPCQVFCGCSCTANNTFSMWPAHLLGLTNSQGTVAW